MGGSTLQQADLTVPVVEPAAGRGVTFGVGGAVGGSQPRTIKASNDQHKERGMFVLPLYEAQGLQSLGFRHGMTN